MARVQSQGLHVVRRFTGGGTVVVDRDTLLVSFIFGAEAAPEVPCFPAPLMSWSERFYKGVFHDARDFRLRENGERAGGAGCGAPPARDGLTQLTFLPQRRLRVWRAKVWGKCSVHHQDEMGAPHIVPVGLPTRAHGVPAAPATHAGVPPGTHAHYMAPIRLFSPMDPSSQHPPSVNVFSPMHPPH
jgi:hypothetical protein